MIVLPFKAFTKYKQSFLSPKLFLGSQRSGLKWQVYNRVWAADYEKAKLVADNYIIRSTSLPVVCVYV